MYRFLKIRKILRLSSGVYDTWSPGRRGARDVRGYHRQLYFKWLTKATETSMDTSILDHLRSLGRLPWKRCGRRPIRYAIVIRLVATSVRMNCDCWVHGRTRGTVVDLRVYTDGIVRHTLCGQVVATVDVSSFLPLEERPAKWVDPFELQ